MSQALRLRELPSAAILPDPAGALAMKPTEIFAELQRDLIGQEDVLRYVAVAIFKHRQGEKFGNLLLIGNSGTGKTTIMRSIEKLYQQAATFREYRVLLILNAHTLATEDGVVDTHRLFAPLEERARQLLGEGATAEEIGRYMERATVCLDEIDKISGVVGGKPYVTGISIQQTLLTLIEGERIHYPVTVTRGKVPERATVDIDTGKMLFLCAGAFEGLYDLVYKRVTSPATRVKLPTTTVYENGKVEIREVFALRHHFRQEDLFEYGMQPQFMSRFDNAIILEDLNAAVLARIFVEPPECVLKASQNFFRKYGIDLEVSEGAVRKIADEAAKHSRIGARALKAVWGKIVKPFEFDPFSRPEVEALPAASGHRLVVDEKTVAEALKAPY